MNHMNHMNHNNSEIKCGVIKQNQSEVGQIQFSFFKLTVCTIFTANFSAENPIKIGQLVPKIRAVEECQKQ